MTRTDMTEIWGDIAIAKEKYCKCGYKAIAYLANSEEGEIYGFRRTTTITCPFCGREINLI